MDPLTTLENFLSAISDCAEAINSFDQWNGFRPNIDLIDLSDGTLNRFSIIELYFDRILAKNSIGDILYLIIEQSELYGFTFFDSEWNIRYRTED